uniref:Uncharacterized protein n=1 Tax=Heterorhabditis bacteriophora TaxID=37862 RepID=A0A1I7WGW3_HETBA
MRFGLEILHLFEMYQFYYCNSFSSVSLLLSGIPSLNDFSLGVCCSGLPRGTLTIKKGNI